MRRWRGERDGDEGRERGRVGGVFTSILTASHEDTS